MSDRSSIEWTDATWNPIRGCSRVSEGCRHCYAEHFASRFAGRGMPYDGLATHVGGESRWTGEVRFIEQVLDKPLRWKKPRRIFVNSMSDLFHEQLPDDWIDQIVAVMALAPQHTFQVLTKRPERMREYLRTPGRAGAISAETGMGVQGKHRWPFIRPDDLAAGWPLPNIWLGVSCEDQATAAKRIPILLQTPAAVRWISAEPLLGPIDLDDIVVDDGKPGEWHINALDCDVGVEDDPLLRGATLDWVVAGGESGPGARPCHPDWLGALQAQCYSSEVPFFLKQLGGYPDKRGGVGARLDGVAYHQFPAATHSPMETPDARP